VKKYNFCPDRNDNISSCPGVRVSEHVLEVVEVAIKNTSKHT
jgi:hypothetical protein